MPQDYETNSEASAVLSNLLDDESLTEFTLLRDHDVNVRVIVKQKFNKDDELVSSGTIVDVKKVPDLYKLFLNETFTHVIVVDKYDWEHADTNMQKAYIHKALMQIEVKVSSAGDVKLGKRKPEITEFRATVQRYGPVSAELVSLRDILARSATAAGQQFRAELVERAHRTDEDAPTPTRSGRRRTTVHVQEGEET